MSEENNGKEGEGVDKNSSKTGKPEVPDGSGDGPKNSEAPVKKRALTVGKAISLMASLIGIALFLKLLLWEWPVVKDLRQRVTKAENRVTAVEEQFKGLDGRFSKVHKRIGKAEERVAAVEERFKGLDNRSSDLEKRVTGLERRYTQPEKRFDRVEKRISNVEERVTKLEKYNRGSR